jgi:hypothetical protein
VCGAIERSLGEEGASVKILDVGTLAVLLIACAVTKSGMAIDCSPGNRGAFELRVMGSTNSEIAVTWQPVTGATRYVVERRTDPTSGTADGSYSVASAITAYGDTGWPANDRRRFYAPPNLSVGVPYYYAVRAQLPGGEILSNCVVVQLATQPVRGVTGDLWADAVLGKPDFAQNAYLKTTAKGVELPGGVLIDKRPTGAPSHLYLADANHNRILGFDHIGHCQGGQTCVSDTDCAGPCTLDPNLLPTVVLGQDSFVDKSACNGDGTGQLFPQRAPATAASLCFIDPLQISVAEAVFASLMDIDDSGALYVPDLFNNRVLKYEDPFNPANDWVAGQVFGQDDFAGNQCNKGAAVDCSTLCLAGRAPHAGVAIDHEGNLWVADPQNARVLRFPKCPRSGTACNGVRSGQIAARADVALGQPNCTTTARGYAGRGLNQLSYPFDIAFDNTNRVLYVADFNEQNDSRILAFTPSPSGDFVTGMAAVPLPVSWPSQVPGTPPQLCGARPVEVTLDSQTRNLWVRYEAEFCVQLVDVSTGRPLITINQTGGPLRGLDVDRDGDPFLVDIWYGLRRFKRSDLAVVPGSQGSAAAPLVFPPAGSDGGGYSGDAFYAPRGVAVFSDPEGAGGDQLIIADSYRILIWDNLNLSTLANGQTADDVYGTPALDDGSLLFSQYFSYPQIYNDHLWVMRTTGGAFGRVDLLEFAYPLCGANWQTAGTGCRQRSTPIRTIHMTAAAGFSGYPVRGVPGVTLAAAPSDGVLAFTVERSDSAVWVADRRNSRVFRLTDLDTTPQVDVVLGQPDAAQTQCNRGSSLQANTLCGPYSVALDSSENVYVSDNGYEVGTNMRVLEFDATLFTPGAQAVLGPSATGVLGTGGDFTVNGLYAASDPFINPLTATFFPGGAMILGQNPYAGAQRFPTVWLSPFIEAVPQLILGDMATYPDASWFVDKRGNLYTAESNWSRVLIYKDPLRRLRFGPYRDAVVADVPAAYFRLGEAAGPTAIDASGNDNNGTYSDTGVTYGADGLIAFDGDTAIRTDGAHGTMAVTLPSQSAYTIEAWVKPDTGATTARNIIARTNDQGPTVDWSQQLRISAGGFFEHYLFDGQDRVVTGTTPVLAGSTYHVVGTAASNGLMHLYVNGADEGLPSSIGTLSADGNRYVLGSHAGTLEHGGVFDYLQGTLDEVAIYDAVLPASRIQAHYSAAVQGLPPTPTWTPRPLPTPPPLNLALGRPATQSSTYGGSTAGYAVDGRKDTFSHTEYDFQAWWQVDLGAVLQLTSINVWNRTDCCFERLADFYVLVSDVPFSSTNLGTTLAQPGVSAYYTPGVGASLTTITVNRTGRYVRVQLSGSNFLHMAEVEVFGVAAPTPTRTTPGTRTPTPSPTQTWTPRPMPTGTSPNLARGQPATQSSTFEGNTAGRAADGNTHGNLWAGSVSHTDNDFEAWWQVDLGAVFSLATVNVWNRTDCCSERLADFYVFVSDEPFTSTNLVTTLAQPGVSAFYTAGVGGTVTTIAVNRTGRYVRVQLSGTNFLQLAEVEVIGEAAPTPTRTYPGTPSPTPTSTATRTATSTATATITKTATPTLSATSTTTLTATVPPSPTVTYPGTPTATVSCTSPPTPTASATNTSTPSQTATSTAMSSPIPSETLTLLPTATLTQISTATATPSVTATVTIATVTPSPMLTRCIGDCSSDGQPAVGDILTMVTIALGEANVDACLAGDANHDAQITIDEILIAVNNALNGCPI